MAIIFGDFGFQTDLGARLDIRVVIEEVFVFREDKNAIRGLWIAISSGINQIKTLIETFSKCRDNSFDIYALRAFKFIGWNERTLVTNTLNNRYGSEGPVSRADA